MERIVLNLALICSTCIAMNANAEPKVQSTTNAKLYVNTSKTAASNEPLLPTNTKMQLASHRTAESTVHAQEKPVLKTKKVKGPSHGLPTIAILDFTTSKHYIKFYKNQTERTIKKDNEHVKHDHVSAGIVPGEYQGMTNTLTSSLINSMVQSHKFNVLERTHVGEVIREQKFNKTEYVSPDNAIKVGKLLGADYLIMGQIEALDTTMKNEKVPYTGDTESVRQGALAVNVQVVDTRSGQVVAAYPIQVSERYIPRGNEIMNAQLFLLRLKNKVAAKATNKIISTVFPIRVMNVTGKQVYLNRGDNADFKVGSVLTIYRQGKPLIDPDTGHHLGSTEQKLGTVKITAIHEKYAIADVVSGEAGTMKSAVAKVNQETPPTDAEPLTPGSSSKPIQW